MSFSPDICMDNIVIYQSVLNYYLFCPVIWELLQRIQNSGFVLTLILINAILDDTTWLGIYSPLVVFNPWSSLEMMLTRWWHPWLVRSNDAFNYVDQDDSFSSYHGWPGKPLNRQLASFPMTPTFRSLAAIIRSTSSLSQANYLNFRAEIHQYHMLLPVGDWTARFFDKGGREARLGNVFVDVSIRDLMNVRKRTIRMLTWTINHVYCYE